MTTNWLDDAQLDGLIAQAEHTRSKAVRFDPEAPGGFRALTEQEDRELIDAIRLPHQRHNEDRDQLMKARERAERTGDLDRADEIGENLRTLDDERARDQRTDPRLPSRDQIDKLWERGDLGEVDRLDRHQARLDRGLRDSLEAPEREDEGRER